MLRLHHIGVAVENIDKAIVEMHLLKKTVDVVHDALGNCDICFVNLPDSDTSIVIELVSGSIVKGILDKHIHQYHIGYKCGYSLDTEVDMIKNKGWNVLSPRRYAVAFDMDCVFLYSKYLGIVELIGR